VDATEETPEEVMNQSIPVGSPPAPAPPPEDSFFVCHSAVVICTTSTGCCLSPSQVSRPLSSLPQRSSVNVPQREDVKVTTIFVLVSLSLPPPQAQLRSLSPHPLPPPLSLPPASCGDY
jgi:hypothetical protein